MCEDWLEGYLADNYGRCNLEAKCQCLRDKWKGQTCPHWSPLGVKTLDELATRIKEDYQKKKC